MERLTERDSNGTNFLVCREGCNGGPACFECEQKAIDRLAAYEDTGVMPEKVTQIKLALEGKLLAEIKEFDGIPADRVIELLQAEKDGRLVVLPVKVGDDVWTNIAMSGWYLRKKDRPYRAKVVYIGLNESEEMGGGIFNVAYGGRACYMLQFSFAEVGKTVFLTKQEAETALREAAENA